MKSSQVDMKMHEKDRHRKDWLLVVSLSPLPTSSSIFVKKRGDAKYSKLKITTLIH